MKKFLVLLISLLMLTACTNSAPQPSTSEELSYLEQLKSFEVKEITGGDKDLAEFDAFLDRIAKETLEDDYLMMHFTIEDPEAMGYTVPELSLGEIDQSALKESHEESVAILEELRSFDYDALSKSQQLDFQVLEYSYLETLALSDHDYDYHFYFVPYGGVHQNIITNFTEFEFRSASEIDDYLVLLMDIDRYLKDLFEYTKMQVENGISMQDHAYDATIASLKDVIAKIDDHALILTFDAKIDAFEGLDESQKTSYKEKNKQIFIDEVVPVYEYLIDEMATLKGTSKLEDDDAGLLNYSKEYAEAMVLVNTSDNRPVDEIFKDAEQYILNELTTLTTILSKMPQEESSALLAEYSSVYDGTCDVAVLNGDVAEIMSFLEEKTAEYYPTIGEFQYEISLLDPSTISASTVAYYLQPAYDNFSHNVIRLNPAFVDGDSLTTYITLAHEGLPGHLYQSNYIHNVREDHLIWRLMSFIGVGEGIAMDAEIEALKWLDFTYPETADFVAFDTKFSYCLYLLADIGIHYYGWDKTEFGEYFDSIGLGDSFNEGAYDYMVDSYMNLTPYGAGLINFNNLRKQYQDLGTLAINEAFTELGEVPFIFIRHNIASK